MVKLSKEQFIKEFKKFVSQINNLKIITLFLNRLKEILLLYCISKL